MLNRQAEPPVSTSVLKALPGKIDIKITHLLFSLIFTAMPFIIATNPLSSKQCHSLSFSLNMVKDEVSNI